MWRMRGRPRRLSVVPHVLRMRRCGEMKSDDSLPSQKVNSVYISMITRTRTRTHLNKYASTSRPLTTLNILHLTISNISSHTFLSTPLNPLRPGGAVRASGTSEAEGANQISSSFSGPSNGHVSASASEEEEDVMDGVGEGEGGVMALASWW